MIHPARSNSHGPRQHEATSGCGQPAEVNNSWVEGMKDQFLSHSASAMTNNERFQRTKTLFTCEGCSREQQQTVPSKAMIEAKIARQFCLGGPNRNHDQSLRYQSLDYDSDLKFLVYLLLFVDASCPAFPYRRTSTTEVVPQTGKGIV